MVNEKFADGSSWVYLLDIRLKLIVTIIFAVTIAVGDNIAMLIQVLFLAIILIITAKLDLKAVVQRLFIINAFVLFIWLFIPFTYPGEVLFELGPFLASKEGVSYAIIITLRSNAIMLLVITFLATSSMSGLIHAMNYLYIPDKLIYLFFFVYRYLHVIKNEFDNLCVAMLIRGFKPKTNLHTYKSYAYLIGMLLIRSYERSQKVYESMLCRGFKGKFYMIDDFSLSSYDLCFSIVSFIIIIWFVFLEKGWVIV
ncbi:cobalt ECF transporter T component CbiQ [Halocella sp. SP3-1]|uniref:cobalt ECF transporter T component CbiQ n=1 Tax=Halocella sp. SP3-1 TaxID=2382161 RepID=UPI000F74E6D3|nr:cobalt ECF transporter T component CbiQ [Halocella sp. SP3-1]AZO95947.1 cobalt ECF transporter T component CbiQ [Halocella sp. SP3-1]